MTTEGKKKKEKRKAMKTNAPQRGGRRAAEENEVREAGGEGNLSIVSASAMGVDCQQGLISQEEKKTVGGQSRTQRSLRLKTYD